MLKQTFAALLTKYSNSNSIQDAYWNEIETNYTSKKRHYHSLLHLENMLLQLMEHKSIISDWDTILFALYYHDIVYKVLKKDNEERSALFAVKRLKAIQYASGRCALCSQHILATKTHIVSKSNDTNIFTDADLSVLGANADTYFTYTKQIRKEYAIYPDFMYNPGRKKVLQHFLQMQRIYKTDHFFEKYEQQAKENMLAELSLL